MYNKKFHLLLCTEIKSQNRMNSFISVYLLFVNIYQYHWLKKKYPTTQDPWFRKRSIKNERLNKDKMIDWLERTEFQSINTVFMSCLFPLLLLISVEIIFLCRDWNLYQITIGRSIFPCRRSNPELSSKQVVSAKCSDSYSYLLIQLIVVKQEIDPNSKSNWCTRQTNADEEKKTRIRKGWTEKLTLKVLVQNVEDLFLK